MGLFGIVKVLMGAAAIAIAAFYVLLSGVYVTYLEGFGLDPEDVGLDRLTILGRVTGPAILVVYFGGALAACAIAINALRSFRNHRDPRDEGTTPTGKDLEARTARRRVYGAATLAMVITLVSVMFLSLYQRMHAGAEHRSDSARAGKPVGGMSLLGIPVVDMRAAPAKVDWVGTGDRPAAFGDKSSVMVYLGRNDRMVALLTCDGTTLMPRPRDVLVRLSSEPDKVKGVWSDGCT